MPVRQFVAFRCSGPGLSMPTTMAELRAQGGSRGNGGPRSLNGAEAIVTLDIVEPDADGNVHRSMLLNRSTCMQPTAMGLDAAAMRRAHATTPRQ